MSGQAALVTGSTRGIGLASALSLARRGFAVAVNGPQNDASLAAAVEQIAATGASVTAIPLDMADIDAHDHALAKAEAEIGPLTTLVNNAGVSVMNRGDPLEAGAQSWDRCFAVNARAVFFMSQAFAKRLLARERNASLFHCIVNVTSANAEAVAPARGEYCASKAAAAMVSKVWAVRLGSEGIAVYDVQPGLIDTAMTTPVIGEYGQRAAAGLTLIPRVGLPEEVGEIIGSLASGTLPYTTGQVISADGGMLVPRF
ncbi:MAG: 3-ketoacyl-ACP reductase [Rhodobacteraceae bacterium]|nr:3-ketoacyl-ACP reductase [Paracoccaceae bacterium]